MIITSEEQICACTTAPLLNVITNSNKPKMSSYMRNLFEVHHLHMLLDHIVKITHHFPVNVQNIRATLLHIVFFLD